MDVTALVTQISNNCPTLAQVVAAQPGGTTTPTAGQAALYTLLQGLVSGRMYPVQLPDKPTYPNIVYQTVSSTTGDLEGYDITRTDIFVVNMRGADYDALLTLVGSAVTALAGENMEITDILHDYDTAEGVYRINLEINYSYLALASQSMPAAFVYPLGRDALPSVHDNFTRQRTNRSFAIVLVTDDNNIPDLLAELESALLGWQETTAHFEMEYTNGSNIEAVGAMEVWREVYGDAVFIEQS